MNPNLVVCAVGEEQVLLLRVMGKGEIVNCSAHAKGRAAGTAALGAARRGRGVHEEAGNKFSFFGEDLNSVASTLADVDEPVIRNVDAMQRGRKLFLIRRRSRFPVIRRGGVIVDLAEGNAVSAPAPLEGAAVHVIHENTFLIDNVKLVGVLIQIEEKDSAPKC